MMDIKKLSDAELVSLYKSNNERAFKVLLNRYKSKVFSTAYFIVKDREVANDLTQDVFFKAIDTIKKGKYNEDGKFQNWIMRVTHNLAIDHYRKNTKVNFVRENDEFSVFETLPFSVAPREDGMTQKEIKLLLKEHIHNLPFEQRQVLLMRHFVGMSFKEIADFTGVSINTALGRMRYALLTLKKQLNPHFAYEQHYYP